MKIHRDRVEAVDLDEELGPVCELALVVADARPWPCGRPGSRLPKTRRAGTGHLHQNRPFYATRRHNSPSGSSEWPTC